MTRARFWTFAALVAVALVANLALVSARFAQTTEEGLGSRLTVASGGVRTQLELLDLRSSPRIAAFNPELIEATRPGPEAAQQPPRPDERALRAAAAALQPEPDLLVVSTAQAAAVSRRGKAASLSEDPSRLPLIRIALEGSAASPQFVSFDGKLYRAAAARIPGSAAVVLTGTLLDDRLAAQLRTVVDADVTFLQQGAAVASSLPTDDRAALVSWAKAPGSAGFGALRVQLPYVGARFSEQLPLGAPRAATRAVLVPLAQGVQAAVSVPAAAPLTWLARYQAFYAAGWALFVLLAFVWGLFAGRGRRAERAAAPAPAPSPARARREDGGAQPRPAAAEAPWSDEPVSAPAPAARGGHQPLDPELPAIPGRDEEPQFGQLQPSAEADPMWSADSFSPPAGRTAPNPGSEPSGLELATDPPAPGQDEPQPGAAPGLGAGWSDAAAAAAAPASGQWGPADSGAGEPWPPPSAEAAAEETPSEDGDPDEAHFRETFDRFMALRAETGEKGSLTYEKFAAKLRQNREQILSRGTARTVRFTVYEKDGRAAIKASGLK